MRLPLFLLAAAIVLGQVQPAGVIAIRNAVVHPANGPAMESATVIVRDGLIAAVGAGIAVPADAWVVEGRGLHVYPGLIDAHSKWGIPGAPSGGDGASARAAAVATPATPPAEPQVQYLDDGGPEERPSNTSWMKAADMVQASDRSIAAARSAGYTAAVVFPTTGIFAGQGSAINLAGERAGEMVVASPVGLRLALGSGGFSSYPGSLMGVFAYIRQVYLDAAHYKDAQAMYSQNPRGLQRPAYDRALEGVLQAERVLLPAGKKVEMERVIKFAAELKKPVILYGGEEAYRAADLLKKAGVPVLFDLKWPERDRDADPDLKESLRILETREAAPAGPAALAKAGVKFAFYSGGVERPGDLRRAIRKAIDAGLDKEEALRALTLYTAQIFGFENRLGSIEPGKIGNLTVTEGDLFDTSTKIKFVVIDGVKYEPAPEAPPTEGAKPARRGGS